MLLYGGRLYVDYCKYWVGVYVNGSIDYFKYWVGVYVNGSIQSMYSQTEEIPFLSFGILLAWK